MQQCQRSRRDAYEAGCDGSRWIGEDVKRQKNGAFKSIEDLREAGTTLLIASRLSRPIGLLF